MPVKHRIRPVRASVRNWSSCSAKPARRHSTCRSDAISGRISFSNASITSFAATGSSSEMSPVTEIKRIPFSRRTVENPLFNSTLTISANGTYSPCGERNCIRSRKSADSSSSGSSTRNSALRVPKGYVAASIPFNRPRNTAPNPSMVKPNTWPCGVSSRIISSLS